MVSAPKPKGGLGVINLRLQNDALLLKHWYKFYNKEDIPSVHLIWDRYYTNKIPHAAREVGSFWWKDVLRLSSLYRTISRCTLGDGSTVLFWDDNWSRVILAKNYSELLQFARNNQSSIRNVLDAQDLESLFMLPLTENAYKELTSLQTFLQSVTYDEAAKNKWTMI